MATTVKSNGVVANGAGDSIPRTNGVLPHDASNSISNGLGLLPTTIAPAMSQLPPEIDHITEGYQPLSKLITRVVEDTFKELTEVIDKMAGMDIHHNHPDRGTNGHMGFDAKVNVDKKMLFMNFIQKRRAQFIKLLVLAQWSRDSEEISRMIDLKVWLDKQTSLHDESLFWLYEMKRTLEPAKLPNPDLSTAIKVLTTGQASWMPDLGYIAPKPLSPQDILKTLKDLNIILHVRLNLYEELPPHFKNFRISDGRATFVVPNEFEVDLSVADEDRESQLFFIDLRLKFSPSLGEIPDGPLRNELTEACNFHLKERGLAGLYNYLHEYVLTAKINALRRQALELGAGLWTGSLKIEFLRRVLIVQYWTGRPGPKHWIEISAFSGVEKDSKGQVKSSGPTFLGLRWVRDGERLSDGPFQRIDEAELSMETILKRIVAQHIKHIFKSTWTTLMQNPRYEQKALELTGKIALIEPADSWLRIQLTASQTATIRIQPVSGMFSIGPSNPLIAGTEAELNSLPNPAVDASARLLRQRSHIAQVEVDQRMMTLGCELVRNKLPPQEWRSAMPIGTYSMSLYRRSGWAAGWFVATGFGAYGEEWKVLQIDVSRSSPTIQDSQSVSLKHRSSKAPPNDYGFLSHVMKAAAGICTINANVKLLHESDVTYRTLTRESADHNYHVETNSLNLPVVAIGFASFLTKLNHEGATPLRTPTWANPKLMLSFQGQDQTSSNCFVSLEARLAKPESYRSILTGPLDKSITFDPAKGAIIIKLSNPFPAPTIHDFYTAMRRIDRLLRLLVTLTSYKLPTTSVSLTHLTFVYSNTPPIHSATISLSPASPLVLTLNPGNSHLLMIDHLTHMLNSSFPFTATLKTLTQTLPVCRALAKIQANAAVPGCKTGEVFILPRAANDIVVRYIRPAISFRIHFRRRSRARPQLYWVVGPHAEFPQGKIKDAILDVWKLRGVAGRWYGLGDRVAATVEGVEDVILKLDELVVNNLPDADTKNKPAEIVVLD